MLSIGETHIFNRIIVCRFTRIVLFQKFCEITTPSNVWGPNDDVTMATYHERKRDTRSLVSVMLYNLTGRRMKCKTTHQVNEKLLFKNDKLTSV